jgi:hypothetical protein
MMDKLQKNQPNRSKPMKKWGKALDFFSYLAIIKANDARIASKKQKRPPRSKRDAADTFIIIKWEG